jgi:CubicO group peptidase (beta-lactamase class C family)
VRRRRWGAAVACIAIVALAVSGAKLSPAGAAGRYDGADAAARDRVEEDSLSGATMLVARGGEVLHRLRVGGLSPTTVIPIASASKWLASATLMTLVDEGTLRLDDPVATHLPSFATSPSSSSGSKAAITVRQLLSHTSGLPPSGCEGDPSTTLARCADEVAAGSGPSFTPGTQFRYGGTGFVVAGALVERLSGTSFETAFEQRIARPLGMGHTRFDGSRRPHSRNPAPAASATSTADDYARFLRMLAAGGTSGSRRILSTASVAEIERDQVRGIDTRRDSAVQITGIPTYGLGVWRDEVAPDDAIEVVSGSGALGFYPWIDRVHGTYGVVAVDDESGAEHAVPASQRIARMLWRAAA